jgi:hypothetical protein
MTPNNTRLWITPAAKSTTVSKGSRGATGTFPSPVAAIRASRSPLLGDVEPDRVEAQPAGVAPADRVLAVRLAVDAALDPNAARDARSHRNPPCLGSRPSPRAAPPDTKLTDS